ncbi:hypothetical protein BHU72_13270 [Desulfuribacillus stibiiarsenatis]|uniref:Uncharacterized protein n=1 Tax=Desulfuribacillus stibiiarsenatis TaxID=1390249 RepID=A0A1E5L899_9FIRM|nr:hypothetical protein [Desulfuribacillus stibiiarsenatis]OEH86387.1 hypothetical protein BHU72_13270 [Desulfuribacillus stibiiarsenatis]
MTRRKLDMNAEQHLANFLDKNFYPWFKDKYNFKSVTRSKEQSMQIKGIDVSIETRNSELVNIDEKAQLYYINKGLPTFAFELNFINRRNDLAEGWLLNDELDTDYYLLVWPYATHTSLKTLTEEDITKLECILIKKSKIHEYLIAKGWDKNRIYHKADGIRNVDTYGRIAIEGEDNFYFFYSDPTKYTESPINLVIKKYVLKKLSKGIFVVTKDEVEEK